MIANQGRRTRPRVNDQEGNELGAMPPPPNRPSVIDLRNTSRSRRQQSLTWPQYLWRLIRRRPVVHGWQIILLAVVGAACMCLISAPVLLDDAFNWMFGDTDDTYGSNDTTPYSTSSPIPPTAATTFLTTTTAEKYTHPHHVRNRQHFTAASDNLLANSETKRTRVPGFYLVPVLPHNPQWTIMLQHLSVLESSAPTLQKAQLPEQRTKILSSSPSRYKTTASKATTRNSPFMFWGATVLPSSNHRSFKDQMTIFCVTNTCSKEEKELKMCNDSMPETQAERVECAWCWDNSTHKFFPNGTAIQLHCLDIVDHSIKTMSIVGSLCLFPLLIILGLLLRRCHISWRSRRAKSQRFTHSTESPVIGQLVSQNPVIKNASTCKNQDREVAEKQPKRCRLGKKRLTTLDEKAQTEVNASQERVLIMPHAVPNSIETEIFSGIRDMGQGKLLQGSNSQEDSLGLSRTSSRRERVLSSGTARIPTILINRVRTESNDHEA